MVSILMIPGLPCSTEKHQVERVAVEVGWPGSMMMIFFVFSILGGFQHLECASSEKYLPYFGD